mmetsp:Transcript_78658/g.228287  ORF Transcript_78658/g.228287 Transcript_78658/m.228287 type:complete len:221 (-) Transcript_78658:832-1494(-)
MVREGELGGRYHRDDGVWLRRHRRRAVAPLDRASWGRPRVGLEVGRDLQRRGMGVARPELDDDRRCLLLALAQHRVVDRARGWPHHVLAHEGVRQHGVAGVAGCCEDDVADRVVVPGMAWGVADREALADRVEGEARVGDGRGADGAAAGGDSSQRPRGARNGCEGQRDDGVGEELADRREGAVRHDGSLNCRLADPQLRHVGVFLRAGRRGSVVHRTAQ